MAVARSSRDIEARVRVRVRVGVRVGGSVRVRISAMVHLFGQKSSVHIYRCSDALVHYCIPLMHLFSDSLIH